MEIIKYVLAAAAGYLIGSFSFSITMSRFLFGKDVRAKGSGNAGATNMARSFGMVPGILTLLGDVAKGLAALTVGHLLCGEWGMTAAGCACLAGHSYPLYYGFRGGKGVSTGLAAAFVADWRAGVAALAVFLIAAFATKKVSLGSILGALGALVCGLIVKTPLPRLVLLIFAVALIILRHSENIRRLIAGTEPDFRVSK